MCVCRYVGRYVDGYVCMHACVCVYVCMCGTCVCGMKRAYGPGHHHELIVDTSYKSNTWLLRSLRASCGNNHVGKPCFSQNAQVQS